MLGGSGDTVVVFLVLTLVVDVTKSGSWLVVSVVKLFLHSQSIL